MLEVTLQEGRNRQIRRIALSLGHRVLDLQRIAIEDLKLGSLAEGCWRELSKQEWADLIQAPRESGHQQDMTLVKRFLPWRRRQSSRTRSNHQNQPALLILQKLPGNCCASSASNAA